MIKMDTYTQHTTCKTDTLASEAETRLVGGGPRLPLGWSLLMCWLTAGSDGDDAVARGVWPVPWTDTLWVPM